MAPADDGTIRWLLAGDSSIRFWTRTLLLGESEHAARADRARIARTGWGRRLLAARASTGLWGGGLYSTKWISTHYTLLQLMGLGVDPRHPGCRGSAQLLLDRAFLPDGGIAPWTRPVSDDCVAAMALGMFVYFGLDDPRIDRVADALLAAEVDGGGWNCRRSDGPTRGASIHTTLSVIEACDEWRRAGRRHRAAEIAAAASRGRQALLSRQLYLSRKTGAPIDRKVATLTYPPRWRFDVLRCLYAFARADVRWDARMQRALGEVTARRGRDGRWKASAEHQGRLHVAMETPRAPGRWHTLRALVVLDRYGDHAGGASRASRSDEG